MGFLFCTGWVTLNMDRKECPCVNMTLNPHPPPQITFYM